MDSQDCISSISPCSCVRTFILASWGSAACTNANLCLISSMSSRICSTRLPASADDMLGASFFHQLAMLLLNVWSCFFWFDQLEQSASWRSTYPLKLAVGKHKQLGLTKRLGVGPAQAQQQAPHLLATDTECESFSKGDANRTKIRSRQAPPLGIAAAAQEPSATSVHWPSGTWPCPAARRRLAPRPFVQLIF